MPGRHWPAGRPRALSPNPDTRKETPVPEEEELAILALAAKLAPAVVAEHGTHPSPEQVAEHVGDYLAAKDLECQGEALELLHTEIRRLAAATDVTHPGPVAEDIDISDLAAQIAPGLVEEHGRWPYVLHIAMYAEEWLAQHRVHLEIGDFELLVDELGEIAPGLTLTAS